MQFISLGHLSLITIFPLIYPISTFLQRLVTLPQQLSKQGVFLSLSGLGQVLLGSILYGIKTYRSKKQHKVDWKTFRLMKKHSQIAMIQHIPNYQRNMILTYLFIFVITCSDSVIYWILNLFLFNESDNSLFTKLISYPIVICNYLFCFFFLKISFYNHHYVSLALLLSSQIVITILEYYQNINDISEDFFEKFLMYLFFPFLTCVYELFCKIIMERKYFNAYKLLFFQGVFALVIFGILVLLSLINTDNNYILTNLRENILLSLEEIKMIFMWPIFVLILFSMIFEALNQLFVLLIIHYYNPTTRVVFYFISFILQWIYSLFQKESNALSIFFGIIGVIAMGFGVLMFNELILIHLWHLDVDTKVAISMRSKFENILEINDYLIDYEVPNEYQNGNEN